MKRVDWNMIAKYLANEPLSDEEKKLIDQVKDDKDLKKQLDDSAVTLNKVDLMYQLKKFDTNKAWGNIDQQIDRKQKIVVLPQRFLRIAAVLIVVLATAFGTMKIVKTNLSTEFQTAQNDISCPEVTLPDGTMVTLNYGSKLHYPKRFKGDNRTVLLEGEAFFNVTTNKQKPFIIKTKGASVKVLGTSFNVKSYANNSLVEVIVRTGQVELIDNLPDKDETNKVLLLPGEMGTLDKNTGQLLKETQYNVNQLAWITHEIEFHFTRLSEVIATLKQVYNIKIELSGDVDLNQIITATFNQQEPSYILDVIALTLDLDISNTGNNSYYLENK